VAPINLSSAATGPKIVGLASSDLSWVTGHRAAARRYRARIWPEAAGPMPLPPRSIGCSGET
jgi:hypothetical protein